MHFTRISVTIKKNNNIIHKFSIVNVHPLAIFIKRISISVGIHHPIAHYTIPVTSSHVTHNVLFCDEGSINITMAA